MSSMKTNSIPSPVTGAYPPVGSGGYDTSLTPVYSPYGRQGDALSSMDQEGRIGMDHNHIHIQPTSNGFVITTFTKEHGIRTYNFSDFKEVIKFIDRLTILTLDNERIAENV